jgi:hypothetical protein
VAIRLGEYVDRERHRNFVGRRREVAAFDEAALAPERVASITALSVGHPAAFRKAGWAQREKSWHMLLFQFPDIAEQWLRADDVRNLREWSGHPDIDTVVARLSDPAALTASLGLYRAIVPPESLVAAPMALPPIAVAAKSGARSTWR